MFNKVIIFLQFLIVLIQFQLFASINTEFYENMSEGELKKITKFQIFGKKKVYLES